MNEFSESEYKPTKSLLFVLPMLGHNYYFYGDCLYNVYIDPIKDYIYIVFKKPLNNFYFFTETFITNFYLFDKFVLDNKLFKVARFRVSKNNVSDFNQFLSGKYSKMSSNYKQHLLMVYNETDEFDYIKKVLYPSKMDRIELMRKLNVSFLPGESNAEIEAIPNLKEENYDYKKFLIKNNKSRLVQPSE